MTPSPTPPVETLSESRLVDLVRYCRHQLYDEKLITDDEFAALVEVGAESARRLESYDALRGQLAQAQKAIALWVGPNTCSVCGGAPLASGRPCVCGGKGTHWAEFEGLRQELFDMESRLAQVEKERDEFRAKAIVRCRDRAAEYRKAAASYERGDEEFAQLHSYASTADVLATDLERLQP